MVDAPDQGLIVAPSEKSPFSFRLVDYQAGLDPTRRMLTGLVHLGIAAVAYPREADLEDDIVVRRSAEQVEGYLREACQALADAEEKDAEEGEGTEEGLAWRAYLAMPSAVRSRKGGYKADCTLGIITRAFAWLIDQGMARESNGTYQLLDRYRVQVREVAGQAALARLRSLVDPASVVDEGDPVVEEGPEVEGTDATNDDVESGVVDDAVDEDEGVGVGVVVGGDGNGDDEFEDERSDVGEVVH